MNITWKNHWTLAILRNIFAFIHQSSYLTIYESTIFFLPQNDIFISAFLLYLISTPKRLPFIIVLILMFDLRRTFTFKWWLPVPPSAVFCIPNLLCLLFFVCGANKLHNTVTQEFNSQKAVPASRQQGCVTRSVSSSGRKQIPWRSSSGWMRTEQSSLSVTSHWTPTCSARSCSRPPVVLTLSSEGECWCDCVMVMKFGGHRIPSQWQSDGPRASATALIHHRDDSFLHSLTPQPPHPLTPPPAAPSVWLISSPSPARHICISTLSAVH